MFYFKNDYSEIAHPEILNALMAYHITPEEGYGEDRHCMNAARILRDLIGTENVAIHFMTGGTQTNLTAISTFLRPHEAVIATHKSHINRHETGAIEATGHKVLTVQSKDGKLYPEQIEQILIEHSDEHMVKPRLVKISNATELGSVYRKKELETLREYCNAKGLLLYMDGARLGSALQANFPKEDKMTLSDIAALTDAFYIGGTKNGAMIGEAFIICNDDLKADFRYLIKQHGGLLAKGAVLGIQFEILFQNGLYFALAAHANRMAEVLRNSLKEAGVPLLAESDSNMLFPILPNELISELEEEFSFYLEEKTDEKHTAIRLVTSWATQEEAVFQLTKRIFDYCSAAQSSNEA